ncbi:MAG: metallophosphoesterase [Pyrinomonadaceae bacterium]|nr:metallophosphoesterase [Pyrinomonadaceae bacterium]
MSPRKKIPVYAAVISVAAVCCVLYAYFIEPQRLVVNESEIVAENWDKAYDGFRIVALSDIHAGSNGVDNAKLRRVVETVNSLDADLVVMLGDFVATTRDRKSVLVPMSEITENLKGMRARYGVFAVLGNHDGWHGDDAVASGLEKAGYRVLQNQIVTIERNGERLRIFGMKDHLQLNSWYTFDMMVKHTVAQAGGDGKFLVLEHSPDMFDVMHYYKSLGDDFGLMIAGHTHGGQIWLPVIGSPIVPSSLGQRYNRGHIREKGRDLFVTTGIGTTLLPFRFMMPPEIAVITVRSGSAK